jgi:hypothetical protein
MMNSGSLGACPIALFSQDIGFQPTELHCESWQNFIPHAFD